MQSSNYNQSYGGQTLHHLGGAAPAANVNKFVGVPREHNRVYSFGNEGVGQNGSNKTLPNYQGYQPKTLNEVGQSTAKVAQESYSKQRVANQPMVSGQADIYVPQPRPLNPQYNFNEGQKMQCDNSKVPGYAGYNARTRNTVGKTYARTTSESFDKVTAARGQN